MAFSSPPPIATSGRSLQCRNHHKAEGRVLSDLCQLPGVQWHFAQFIQVLGGGWHAGERPTSALLDRQNRLLASLPVIAMKALGLGVRFAHVLTLLGFAIPLVVRAVIHLGADIDPHLSRAAA